ncbi:hypothetical protein SMICM17S_04441 [Streptomyces microflavus]
MTWSRTYAASASVFIPRAWSSSPGMSNVRVTLPAASTM